MIWKTLILLTGSESPVRLVILLTAHRSTYTRTSGHTCLPDKSLTLPSLQVVVVLSGSMEPGFYRGDILFLRVGEIVVFNMDNREIPLVHRVIKVHETEPGGEVSVLTKVRLANHKLDFYTLACCTMDSLYQQSMMCVCPHVAHGPSVQQAEQATTTSCSQAHTV